MEELINKLKDSDLKLLERVLGIPYDRMYKWVKGKSNPKSADYNLLLTYFNTGKTSNDIDKLPPNPRLEAKPTRLYADPIDHEASIDKIINLPDGTVALRVPIVPARAYAGYMRGFADPEYYDDLDEILIGVDKEPRGTYIGFEVVGDSMICLDTVELAEESIFPGRIAIGRDLDRELWKTRLHTHNYKNWIFVHRTEGILIKQIAKHDVANGIITVHSINPAYKDEDLNLKDMQQIFSVIQIVQRTRPKLK
jgi:hypothetical protein